MSWKTVGFILPWVLLLSSIVVSNAYMTGTLPGRYADIAQLNITQPHNRWERLLLGIKDWMLQAHMTKLQLLGYNYSRDLAQLTVSIWNKGSVSISVTGILYDGASLTQGVTGSTQTLTANNLIFASTGQWNMDTGGPSSPTIEANSIVTLYLGVGPTAAGSQHSLEITAGAVQFSFPLQN